MGSRKVIIKQSVADNISSIAWFIESKGLIVAAEKFADDIYDYFTKMGDEQRSYPVCKEPVRAALNFKCIPYKKKYTIVFIETETELLICEFISSKPIHW